MTAAAIVTVLAGFGETYYFQPITGAPRLPLLIHLHGLVFSAWMALLLAQTILVAAGRVDVHRRFGAAGGVLALGMVILGTFVAVARARDGRGFREIFREVDVAVSLAFALGDLVVFSCFVAAGLYWRRTREVHRRLMLLATIGGILPAALARLPYVGARPPLIFAVFLLFLSAGPMYDLWTRRRVHPVHLWGGVLTALSVPLRIVVGESDAWRSAVGWLIR
jgi:hypothetical protein